MKTPACLEVPVALLDGLDDSDVVEDDILFQVLHLGTKRRECCGRFGGEALHDRLQFFLLFHVKRADLLELLLEHERKGGTVGVWVMEAV